MIHEPFPQTIIRSVCVLLILWLVWVVCIDLDLAERSTTCRFYGMWILPLTILDHAMLYAVDAYTCVLRHIQWK